MIQKTLLKIVVPIRLNYTDFYLIINLFLFSIKNNTSFVHKTSLNCNWNNQSHSWTPRNSQAISLQFKLNLNIVIMMFWLLKSQNTLLSSEIKWLY